ncbi:MAG: flagellar motor switch protein FliM [Firmicutes bacterium]|nr:flagellar motor switch protein FliM [Bacillota bacterium]
MGQLDDILSQQEIDELINQVAGQVQEDEVSDEVAVYDFKRPHRFSKERVRALHRIHEQFAREFSGMISAKLRSRVELTVQSIEQLTFGEFIRSVPNPSVIILSDMQPLEGSLIMQLSPDISFLLYDRLCGGPGMALERPRELTDIELAVLTNQLFEPMVDNFANAWSDFMELTVTLQSIESNPQFLQVMQERETVILISLALGVGKAQDFVNICISYSALEPVLKKLTSLSLFGSLRRRPGTADSRNLQAKVKETPITVNVELGTTVVTVADLLNLQVGDVISLDRKQHENLEVHVGDLGKFLASPGKLGDKLGIVITAVRSQERSEFDG